MATMKFLVSDVSAILLADGWHQITKGAPGFGGFELNDEKSNTHWRVEGAAWWKEPDDSLILVPEKCVLGLKF